MTIMVPTDTEYELHNRTYQDYADSGAKSTYVEWLEFHLNLATINNQIFQHRIRNLEARVAIG